MDTVPDLLKVYVSPRQVARRRLGAPASEGRSLATLFAGCFLLFLSSVPEIIRNESTAAGEIPLAANLSGQLLGSVFLAPLVFYALAALAVLTLRIFRIQVAWRDSRLVLFWAVLAAAPLALALRTIEAFATQPWLSAMVWPAIFAAFLLFWSAGLKEAGGTALVGGSR